MEDIESIVDQVLAGHSTEERAASSLLNDAPHVRPATSPPYSTARVAHASSSPAPPSRWHQPVSLAAAAPVPGSVEDTVERILRGEHVASVESTSAVGPSPTSRSPRSSVHDGSEPLHGLRWGAQRVDVPASRHASPSAPVSGRRHRSRATDIASRLDEEYSVGVDDPLLRRFALWQERKDVKRVQAVYDALVQEKAQCTFQPDLRPEALLNSSVVVGATPSPRAEKSRSPPGARLAGAASEQESEFMRRAAHTSSRHSSVTWQSLLAPSRLYEANQAWGFDDHVERLRQAQEAREARAREEDYERTRYADFSTFRRGPTRFEPFHLRTSQLNRGRPGATSSASARRTVSPPLRDKLTTPIRATSLSTMGDGAFDTLAPQIRQALLFTPEMNERLQQATAATLHRRDNGDGTVSSSATPSVMLDDESDASSRREKLPPTGHFSNSSLMMMQRF